MRIRVRSLLCTGLLLLLSMAYAFASASILKVQISPVTASIQKIRFQTGTIPDKGWKSIPTSGSLLQLEDFDGETEFLFVQQAEAEEAWGDLYAYQYDNTKKAWSLVAFPPKGPVRFHIKASSGPVQMLRYQHGSEPGRSWVVSDDPASALLIEEFDSANEFLFVQQTENNDDWGTMFTYQYDYLQKSWSLYTPKPESRHPSNQSFDVKAYGLVPSGCSSDFYSYLLGGAFQANISLGKLLGYTSLTFSKGPPKSDWVKSQQALGMAVGIGYPLPLSEKVGLIPELGYGVIFHFLDADSDKDGTYGFEFFVDQQIRLALYITYEMSQRYTLFIAPLGVLFFEKSDFGLMYGCQAGLRITL